jgi:hypothetical protein
VSDTLDRGDAPSAAAPAGHPSPGRPWVKALIALMCLGITVMWIYAFFFASKKAAYKVDDPVWRKHAEAVCHTYEEQRLALVDTAGGYIAHPTHEQMVQRADVVDRATELLLRSLDDVTTVVPSSARDQALVAKYRGYYETVIADRRAYTASLRAFDLVPYRETVVDGGPVSNILIDFVTVNQIKSCSPPGELNGD